MTYPSEYTLFNRKILLKLCFFGQNITHFKVCKLNPISVYKFDLQHTKQTYDRLSNSYPVLLIKISRSETRIKFIRDSDLEYVCNNFIICVPDASAARGASAAACAEPLQDEP